MASRFLTKGKKKEAKPAAAAPASASASAADRHGDLLKKKKTAPAASSPAKKAEAGASDASAGNVRKIMHLTVIEGKNIGSSEAAIPIFTLDYHGQEVRGKTSNGMRPKWNQQFAFDVTDTDRPLVLWVFDIKDPKTAVAVGGTRVVLRPEAEVKTKEVTLINPENTEPPAQPPKITLSYYLQVKSASIKLSMDDFNIVRTIGRGSFGKVMVVEKKDTGQVYAMKVLSKQHLKDRGEIEHTVSERRILEKHNSPFLVSLKFSFQTPEKVYFVMDFVRGGELFVHLQREETFSEERSRFFAAMLVLALKHLHEQKIVYRDLKPENILVDMNGYLKLADFGLCKEDVDLYDKTKTFCGTPEYMAPEVLQQKGYGQEVDWWSIGTLLFEMMTGLPPFYNEDTQEMYRRILFQPLHCPSSMSPAAAEIVTALLHRDPTKRLGHHGAAEVQSHPFFDPIDWDMLGDKRLPAPWKPTVKSATDTSNFDEDFTSQVPKDTPVRASRLTRSVQKKFAGFTFVDESEMDK